MSEDPTHLPASTDELRVELDGHVLRLTATRPERLNALTGSMSRVLSESLEAAAALAQARCVVLRGEGGSLGAGADVGGEKAHERFDVRAMDATSRLVRAVTSLEKPVLAVVDGVAARVSCGLALACDLVVATERARFLLAFTRIGLMPDGGTTFTVAAAVGRAKAMRMALLAEALTGSEAHAAGLVSHLVEAADLEAALTTLEGRLVTGPPLAYAATKRAVNAATLTGLDAALDLERADQTRLMRTDDVAEGMRAFGEKRRAEFTGR